MKLSNLNRFSFKNTYWKAVGQTNAVKFESDSEQATTIQLINSTKKDNSSILILKLF